jgi:hypothetical protein
VQTHAAAGKGWQGGAGEWDVMGCIAALHAAFVTRRVSRCIASHAAMRDCMLLLRLCLMRGSVPAKRLASRQQLQHLQATAAGSGLTPAAA